MGHSNLVLAVAFSPDGKLALSGSVDGSTRLWHVQTGKEMAQMLGFEDGEWVTITPPGFYLASPKGDKYINVRVKGNQVRGIKPSITAQTMPLLWLYKEKPQKALLPKKLHRQWKNPHKALRNSPYVKHFLVPLRSKGMPARSVRLQIVRIMSKLYLGRPN